ncbi:MAG: CsgG/HfaB family protein [Bacteroidota bacterium]
MKRFLLAISLAAGICCVVAQKKILKQAAAFETSQLYEQAAEMYMKALYQNATRPESIQGLTRTSQKVVDGMLSNYFVARNADDLVAATSQFETILAYQEKLTYFNIQAEIPSYHFRDYEQDKKQLFIDQADEEESETLEKLETLYDQGIRAFQNENWWESWQAFKKIEALSGEYKDTKNYKKKIREKATPIAILPSNQNAFRSEKAFRSHLISELLRLNNPLIKLIEREHLEQVIEEQKLGLSGIIDEKSAAALGRLLGAKAVIIMQVVHQQFNEGQLVERAKTAYTSSEKMVHNDIAQSSRLITDYQPVAYRDFTKENTLLASLDYRLISTETAEILSSDLLRETYKDRIHYATFDGNPYALYHSDGQVIFKSGPERNAFLALFSDGGEMKSQNEMTYEVQRVLSERLASSIHNYFLND